MIGAVRCQNACLKGTVVVHHVKCQIIEYHTTFVSMIEILLLCYQIVGVYRNGLTSPRGPMGIKGYTQIKWTVGHIQDERFGRKTVRAVILKPIAKFPRPLANSQRAPRQRRHGPKHGHLSLAKRVVRAESVLGVIVTCLRDIPLPKANSRLEPERLIDVHQRVQGNPEIRLAGILARDKVGGKPRPIPPKVEIGRSGPC
jgi:hypothetical protein